MEKVLYGKCDYGKRIYGNHIMASETKLRDCSQLLRIIHDLSTEGC